MSEKLKQYRVRVKEMHSDIVYVDATSREQARHLAPHHANCEFECLWDCEILDESEIGAEVGNE